MVALLHLNLLSSICNVCRKNAQVLGGKEGRNSILQLINRLLSFWTDAMLARRPSSLRTSTMGWMALLRSLICSDVSRPYGHALVAGIERGPQKVLLVSWKHFLNERSSLAWARRRSPSAAESSLSWSLWTSTMSCPPGWSLLQRSHFRYTFDAGLDKGVVGKVALKDAVRRIPFALTHRLLRRRHVLKSRRSLSRSSAPVSTSGFSPSCDSELIN